MSSVYDGLPNRPAPTDPDDLPDDPRLLQAVQDFLRELEAGRRPSWQEFLRRYPDLAEALEQCLDLPGQTRSGPIAVVRRRL